MATHPYSNSRIVAEYRARTPRSEAMAAQARRIFPSGITHDSRILDPYTIYVERGQGARKWDVDGNEYVDYYGGHGALILGHSHPKVVAAVARQMELGTQYGANHPLEIRWGEQVRRMIPCAERVRFTSSGTEATHLALRLARSFTGKTKLLRFLGHFHGWHDHMASGHSSHYDGKAATGVLPEVADNVILAPTDSIEPAREILESRDDIAAVILEPTGASWGQVPLPPGFVETLREITARRGVLLIFDEVVTGFRASPGGAQQALGVTPDMCSLAKILAGGLPGGAVAGRKDVLDGLDFAEAAAKGREKVGHQGTYNANPLSAAAGVTALELIAAGGVCDKANATGEAVRRGFNRVLEEEGVPWACYGQYSGFFLYLNPTGLPITPSNFDPLALGFGGLKAGPKNAVLGTKLRLAMLNNGVDLNGHYGGSVSAAHTEADVTFTLDALRESLRALRAEGELPTA